MLNSKPFFSILQERTYPLGGKGMITFIHAADLHLDTPFLGLEQLSTSLSEIMRKAPFQSFQKIVDQAIENEVDFVLLSGDLYNTQKINIQAQSTFIKQLQRLNQVEIPVFLIRGNHDYLTEGTQTLALPLPENVYTYSAEVTTHMIETKGNKKVAVSGFSYDSQWVHERKIKAYPQRLQNVDMHIGMLHGDAENTTTINGNYAPFTVDELRQKNYDYWALGHIHQRQQLSTHPLAIYPGNIQGLHKNETGEKGCLLVEWSERGEKIEFIPTAPIIWAQLQIDLSGVENITQLIQRMHEKIEEKNISADALLYLMIQVNKEDNKELIHFVQTSEFSEELSKQINLPNVWIAQTEVKVNQALNQQSLGELYPKEWSQAVNNAEKLTVFNEMTEKILNNIPRKYLTETNSTDYRKQMIEKAIAKIYLK